MTNQEQNPPQQEQPFVATKQVGFNLEEIILNTNNKVALLYLEHNNKDNFKCVFDFISKCCLRKLFTRSPNMYKEYLAEFWYSTPTGGIYGELGVNTFRNAIGAHYLPHSSEDSQKDCLLPPRWRLLMAQIIQCLGVAFKAPKSSQCERVPKALSLELKTWTHKHSTSSYTTLCSQQDGNKRMHKEDQKATGGPTSLRVTSEARANPQLSSGMSAFNLNGPIYSASFIIHFESASENDALAASTAEADPGKSTPSDFLPQQQGMNEGTKNTSYDHLFVVEKEEASSIIKLEDLAKLVSNVQPSFKYLDSPEDKPIIVVDDSDENEEDEVHTTTEDTSYKLEIKKNKVEAEVALLNAQPSFPNVGHLNELLFKSLQTEFSKILSTHDFSSSLPTKLKDLSSKFNELTEEVKGLKQQVHELEIELLGNLKEIPSKLEDFTKIITSLTSQVDELKTLQRELLAEFVSLPVQVASVQA
ncbi:hypothetical protein Tco_1317751 [Tanacetum coccineum]